ncbi:hypothetical protein SPLC1_S101550 [Arthrospira platensis C1]|nr:hypothetical protein SPLC1_S101550 [Arthrospira platensis C1]
MINLTLIIYTLIVFRYFGKFYPKILTNLNYHDLSSS